MDESEVDEAEIDDETVRAPRRGWRAARGIENLGRTLGWPTPQRADRLGVGFGVDALVDPNITSTQAFLTEL